MQVIVPLAGKGTRLRPHTHLVPKPLIKVAGRPVMDWVMDRLEGLDVTELICITGHLKDQVEEYVRRRYPIASRFVVQEVQDGTARAINLARPFVTGPVFIIFVDTVFEADLSIVRQSTDDAIIWAMEVEDYQRFGVIVTDTSGYMQRIVEKPREPISRLANIGLYYVRDVDAMWQGIDHVLAGPPTNGEWYLTDAFQWMIERGKKIRTAEVTGWYDCGALGTTLETNAMLLRRGPGPPGGYRSLPAGGTIIEPCHIGPGVVIQQSSVGPNVSVDEDTVIKGSTVRDAIIGARCRISGSRLANAILGDDVAVEGFSGSLSVGSHSEVRGPTSAQS